SSGQVLCWVLLYGSSGSRHHGGSMFRFMWSLAGSRYGSCQTSIVLVEAQSYGLWFWAACCIPLAPSSMLSNDLTGSATRLDSTRHFMSVRSWDGHYILSL